MNTTKRKVRKKFLELAAMARLDWDGMHRKINQLTSGGHQSTLKTLLDQHPPENGAVEVVGYVRIARDDGHLVDREHSDSIELPSGKRLDFPRITFLPRNR